MLLWLRKRSSTWSSRFVHSHLVDRLQCSVQSDLFDVLGLLGIVHSLPGSSSTLGLLGMLIRIWLIELDSSLGLVYYAGSS